MSSLNVTRNGKQYVARTVVSNTGTAPVRDVKTQVLDNRDQVGLTAISDLAPGASTTLRFTWPAHGRSTSQVTAVVDPANVVGETDEADNKLVQDVK